MIHYPVIRLDSVECLSSCINYFTVLTFDRFLLLWFQSLTIHDVKLTSIQDVGTQFFLTDNDVAQSKNR